MSALQTAAPALAGPLIVLAGCLLVGLTVGALGSTVVRRLSNPVVKYRYLYVGVVLPFAAVSFVLLLALDFGTAVAAALPVQRPGVVPAAVRYATEAGGACLVGLAAYAPTVRGVRAVRDIDLPTGNALVKMGRWALGLVVVYTVIRLLLRAGAGSSPPVVVALVAALLVGTLFLSPWLIGALRATTVPDAETEARLDRLRSRAGLSVRDSRLFDTDAEGTAEATVRGLGPARRLFVSTTFLDAFDDGTAAALLAVQAGRVRVRRLPKLVGLLCLVILVTVLPGGSWLRVGVAAALVPVAFWVGRRGVRAADDDAADRVGEATVADALERYAAVHDMEPARRSIPNPLSPSVPLGDRIDRLRERTE